VQFSRSTEAQPRGIPEVGLSKLSSVPTNPKVSGEPGRRSREISLERR